MFDALESYYKQKVTGLSDRLKKENFPWNVKTTFHLSLKLK